MIELSEPLLHALDAHQGQPLRVIDPRTRQTYVLLQSEWFDRVKSAIDGDDGLEGIDVGKLIAQAMQEDDANDPLLESYQKYKKAP